MSVEFASLLDISKCNDRTGCVTDPVPCRSTTGPDWRRFNFRTSSGPLFAFSLEIDRDLLALKSTIAAMRLCSRNGVNGA